jgi:hypothetical protein
MDSRVLIELINLPFLREGGSPAEYGSGLDRAIAKGWLWKHESVWMFQTTIGIGCHCQNSRRRSVRLARST